MGDCLYAELDVSYCEMRMEFDGVDCGIQANSECDDDVVCVSCECHLVSIVLLLGFVHFIGLSLIV